jgi:hypothetical protein
MARNTHADARSPEEIERDLEQTRMQITRTIDAIQSRLTPGQVFQEVYDLARGGPTDYVRNLGLAAKNNPVPLALVGVGLAWLATSGGRTPSYLRGARGAGYDAGASGGGSEAMGDAATAAGGYIRSAADDAAAIGRSAADIASEASGRVDDMAAGASQRVRQMSDDVRSLAAEWGEGAASAGEAARERARRAGAKAQDQAARLRDSASHLWREQPLVVGALALAAGAMLGAMLPSTRRENELMGETRDQFVDQATLMGEQALDEATAAARSAMDAAAGAATGEAAATPDPSQPESTSEPTASARPA